MRKILINFLTDRIAPLAKKISEANEELVNIESIYNNTTDHASLIEILISEIEGLRKKMSAIDSELQAIDTAPLLVETPKKSSTLSQNVYDIEPMTIGEILTRDFASSKSSLKIKEKQLQHHQKQLSLPKRKEELETLVKEEHEALFGQIDELNQLILNGEKPSVFRWTKKLDLFTKVDGYGFMHYLAHYDVLQYVLPVMLDNSSIIANRELSGRYDEL